MWLLLPGTFAMPGWLFGCKRDRPSGNAIPALGVPGPAETEVVDSILATVRDERGGQNLWIVTEPMLPPVPVCRRGQ